MSSSTICDFIKPLIFFLVFEFESVSALSSLYFLYASKNVWLLPEWLIKRISVAMIRRLIIIAPNDHRFSDEWIFEKRQPGLLLNKYEDDIKFKSSSVIGSAGIEVE